MKVKVSIEIESSDYEKIKQDFNDLKQKMQGHFPFQTIEAYIADIVSNFVGQSDKIKNLNSRFEELLKNLGGADAIPGFSDFLKSYWPKPTETKKEEEKDNKDKLKN
ncbi:MAG: hypothetical protein LBG49_02245 [Mycoplasmataceae bacterium]|jgi:hypothetical protein|nr:hypothetical protein [Mycoplasmataceae bacterium]